MIKILKFQRDTYYFLLELLDKYSHILEHMPFNVSKQKKYKNKSEENVCHSWLSKKNSFVYFFKFNCWNLSEHCSNKLFNLRAAFWFFALRLAVKNSWAAIWICEWASGRRPVLKLIYNELIGTVVQ